MSGQPPPPIAGPQNPLPTAKPEPATVKAPPASAFMAKSPPSAPGPVAKKPRLDSASAPAAAPSLVGSVGYKPPPAALTAQPLPGPAWRPPPSAAEEQVAAKAPPVALAGDPRFDELRAKVEAVNRAARSQNAAAFALAAAAAAAEAPRVTEAASAASTGDAATGDAATAESWWTEEPQGQPPSADDTYAGSLLNDSGSWPLPVEQRMGPSPHLIWGEMAGRSHWLNRGAEARQATSAPANFELPRWHDVEPEDIGFLRARIARLQENIAAVQGGIMMLYGQRHWVPHASATLRHLVNHGFPELEDIHTDMYICKVKLVSLYDIIKYWLYIYILSNHMYVYITHYYLFSPGVDGNIPECCLGHLRPL